MPKISISADPSVTALQASIDMLRARERRWRKNGSKRALVRYLASVFDLYTAWKRGGVAHTTVVRMAKLASIRNRTGRHPVRTIIDATSKGDRRSKSRWTQALRYAWRERGRWSNLTRCLDANGGIAGCASKWADQQSWKRTPKGFVRVGGEERVPKIPFFVSVDMIDEERWRTLVFGS